MTQKQISPNTAQYDIRVQLRERVATEAVEAYGTYLSRGDFKRAAYIAEEHKLGKVQMQVAAGRVYEANFSIGDFGMAARIAKEYELGRKKELEAAQRAYEICLSKGDFKSAADVATNHELGEDIVKDTYALESLIRA